MAQAVMLDDGHLDLDSSQNAEAQASEYNRWFHAMVQEGLADLNAGKVLSHEEVKKLAARRRAELLAKAGR